MKQFFEAHAHLLDPVREFPFSDRAAYAEFLAQTYHYVTHTTRLLGLVASRIGPDREKLHFGFMKHAAEERSHHLLAEHDLEKLDDRLANHPPLAVTSALQECQYYRVLYQEPTSIFGHIVALEGVASLHGPWVYETVRNAHGEAASTFVKLHAEDDPSHMRHTFEAISRLTEREKELIRANFLHTSALYATLLREMAAEITNRARPR
jgi:thiaminase